MIWPFKRKPKPVALVFKRHRMSMLIENPRFGRGAADFKTGWFWHCCCGRDNSKLNWKLPDTEAEALEQFANHELIYY